MLFLLIEMVCELGVCVWLVGVDCYFNFFVFVNVLFKVGGLDDINVELIVFLKFDLVLVVVLLCVFEWLWVLGILVVVLEFCSYWDV